MKNSSEEGYKPSHREISEAESTMTSRQRDLSDIREKRPNIAMIESVLGPDFICADNGYINCEIKGHQIGAFFEEGILLSIDGVEIKDENVQKKFYEKYRNVLEMVWEDFQNIQHIDATYSYRRPMREKEAMKDLARYPVVERSAPDLEKAISDILSD